MIWSSTWVAIKFGLEDSPPLLGAGLRSLAGVLLFGFAALQRRPLRTDWLLARCSPRAVRVRVRTRLLGRAAHPVGPRRGAVRGAAALHGMIAGIFLPEEPLRRRSSWACWSPSAASHSASQRASTRATTRSHAGAAALALSPLGAAVGRRRPEAASRQARRGGAERLGDARPAGCCCSRPPRRRELGRVRVDARVPRLDRLPRDRRVGGDVRRADRAAAPPHGAGDLVPRHAAAVRGARLRRRLYDERITWRALRRRAAVGGRRACSIAPALPPRRRRSRDAPASVLATGVHPMGRSCHELRSSQSGR